MNLPTLKADVGGVAQNTVTVVATLKATGAKTTSQFSIGIDAADLVLDSQVAQLDAVVDVLLTNATSGNYIYAAITTGTEAYATNTDFDNLKAGTWSLTDRTLTLTTMTYSYEITITN